MKCVLLQRAFTLIELLVVIAVIASLAALLLPALAKAKEKANQVICASNKRQIVLACSLYAQDSNGDYPAATWNHCARPWVSGAMGWFTEEVTTNLEYLKNPQRASIAIYAGYSTKIYKCPADKYLSSYQRKAGLRERPRSVSMNPFLGPSDDGYGPSPWSPRMGWKQYRNIDSMRKVSPAACWLVMDEHPDSLRSPGFHLTWEPAPNTTYWPRLPAAYHENGSILGFVDGHTERKKWLVKETLLPVTYVGADTGPNGGNGWNGTKSPRSTDRRDYEWVFRHASERIDDDDEGALGF